MWPPTGGRAGPGRAAEVVPTPAGSGPAPAAARAALPVTPRGRPRRTLLPQGRSQRPGQARAGAAATPHGAPAAPSASPSRPSGSLGGRRPRRAGPGREGRARCGRVRRRGGNKRPGGEGRPAAPRSPGTAALRGRVTAPPAPSCPVRSCPGTAKRRACGGRGRLPKHRIAAVRPQAPWELNPRPGACRSSRYPGLARKAAVKSSSGMVERGAGDTGTGCVHSQVLSGLEQGAPAHGRVLNWMIDAPSQALNVL